MKYLIVNVDDLGGSRGINRGILEAHRRSPIEYRGEGASLLSRRAARVCSKGRRPGEVYAFDCCRSCGLKRIPLLCEALRRRGVSFHATTSATIKWPNGATNGC